MRWPRVPLKRTRVLSVQVSSGRNTALIILEHWIVPDLATHGVGWRSGRVVGLSWWQMVVWRDRRCTVAAKFSLYRGQLIRSAKKPGKQLWVSVMNLQSWRALMLRQQKASMGEDACQPRTTSALHFCTQT